MNTVNSSDYASKAIKHLVSSPMLKGLDFNGRFGLNEPKIKHILADKNDIYKLLFCSGLRNVQTCAKLFCSEKPKFHQYAHHVNSSQIFCINVFGPLMILADSYKALRSLLEQMGVVFKSPIVRAQFEFTPEAKRDRTQFDFYVKTLNGEEAFFEIKYTERKFGTPSKGSYRERAFYAQLCRASVNLSAMADMDVDDSMCEEFFKNFQIWRNVGHVQNDKQYSVFLFPFRNKSLSASFPMDTMKNVLKIDSERIDEYADAAFGFRSALTRYYHNLKETYFNF